MRLSTEREKVARGIYITADVWPDELFIMQVRSSTAIFSGETALFLHGFLDRNKVEVQNFQTAIKGYMPLKDKKISRLIEYAEKLGIRDEVMKYVEVLV